MTALRTLQALSIGLLLTVACGERPAKTGEWIDLSHEFSAETIYWPTSEPFRLETVAEGVTEKGYYYSAYKFCAAEHGGTHVDAPIHFAEGRKTVDEIPLSQLIAPGVKLDVSAKALADRDYQVRVEDFVAWESENGRIPDGAIVLLQTGFGRFWSDRARYLGTDKSGSEAVPELHFPGLSPDAADWLIKNRRVAAVGLDTPSIDFGQSQEFRTHVILLGENIPVFENVADMTRLPSKVSRVVAMPMKIKGGSGAPLRIAALVGGSDG